MKKFKFKIYIHGSLETIEIEAVSKEEAIGKLLMKNITSCYDHIKKIEEI